jgi:hypothetical protein
MSMFYLAIQSTTRETSYYRTNQKKLDLFFTFFLLFQTELRDAFVKVCFPNKYSVSCFVVLAMYRKAFI